MEKWKKFEHLVKAIHEIFDGGTHSVEHDVDVMESNGTKHQVDVVLRPNSPFAHPILVSCKSGKDPVEKEHVREWSDIVAHTGAGAGVIVSPSGFTSGAIGLASEPSRRITLWTPRALTLDDFKPDEKSPNGYIASVEITMHLRVLLPNEESFALDIKRADGIIEGREMPIVLSDETRGSWYLRDEQDNVVGNLWDLYIAEGERIQVTGDVWIKPEQPRFLVLQGVRLRFNSMRMTVEVQDIEHKLVVDVTETAFAYENAVTGQVKIVPLPPSVLESRTLR